MFLQLLFQAPRYLLAKHLARVLGFGKQAGLLEGEREERELGLVAMRGVSKLPSEVLTSQVGRLNLWAGSKTLSPSPPPRLGRRQRLCREDTTPPLLPPTFPLSGSENERQPLPMNNLSPLTSRLSKEGDVPEAGAADTAFLSSDAWIATGDGGCWGRWKLPPAARMLLPSEKKRGGGGREEDLIGQMISFCGLEPKVGSERGRKRNGH